MLEDALEFANLAEKFSKQEATKQSNVEFVVRLCITYIHHSCGEERQEKQRIGLQEILQYLWVLMFSNKTIKTWKHINFVTAILLAHLKLSPSQIKQAVLAMDTSVLSEQHLQQMETFAPDKKEVYRTFHKDIPHNVSFSRL